MGLIDYREALAHQLALFQAIVDIKLENRKRVQRGLPTRLTPNYLLFCQHKHVYTLGKSGDEKHLLLNDVGLKEKRIAYMKTNRGGDITYHGPGQLVVYPILDLDNFFTDIHKYLRLLETVIIDTLATYHIKAGRIKELTGVWVNTQCPQYARKICAIGIKMGRWVTMHGFALNVNTDLHFFKNIIPCGIADKGVTSIEKELGKQVPMKAIKAAIIRHFTNLFEIEPVLTA